MKKSATTSKGPDRLVVASNKRARRDYEIIDTVEAGLQLVGSEVKSLRDGHAQLADAYGRFIGAEAWIEQLHIPQWRTAHGFGAHDPDRRRKMLLHRAEINRLRARVDQDKLTLIPLQLYFTDGRAKLELALARGRKNYDKRQVLAKKEADREAQRAMSDGLRRRYR